MRIGSRDIAPGERPYIIAELGVNHDGSVERALSLIDLAARAGADAVKLQLFRAEMLLSRAARLASYQHAAGERDPLDMLLRLEIPAEAMGPLVESAHAAGLDAIVTVFSVELVPEAQRIAWDAYKTASPDIIHRPLLDSLAATGKPMLISTGASTLDEVQRAVGWLAPARDRLALLQCVSSYPVPPGCEALEGIAALRQACGGAVGYSDHTTSEQTGALAVALGACVLEKHVTDDPARQGPDHAASLSEDGFARYVRLALGAAGHAPHAPAGPASKRILDCERDVREVSRQSVVTMRALPAGHVIAREDLTFKRPGSGIAPFHLATVVGARTRRTIDADAPLLPDDLDESARATLSGS